MKKNVHSIIRLHNSKLETTQMTIVKGLDKLPNNHTKEGYSAITVKKLLLHL